MADILTHVLMAYIAAKLLSARVDWITTPYLTAAMFGGVIPDINKLELVIPAETVESAIGLPFSWDGLHRLGGVAASIGIVAYLVPTRHRRRLVCMLALGAGLHLVTDAFAGSGVGAASDLLWPLTAWEPVVPRFYVSSDVRIAPIFVALAAITWAAVEWYEARSEPAADLDRTVITGD